MTTFVDQITHAWVRERMIEDPTLRTLPLADVFDIARDRVMAILEGEIKRSECSAADLAVWFSRTRRVGRLGAFPNWRMHTIGCRAATGAETMHTMINQDGPLLVVGVHASIREGNMKDVDLRARATLMDRGAQRMLLDDVLLSEWFVGIPMATWLPPNSCFNFRLGHSNISDDPRMELLFHLEGFKVDNAYVETNYKPGSDFDFYEDLPKRLAEINEKELHR